MDMYGVDKTKSAMIAQCEIQLQNVRSDLAIAEARMSLAATEAFQDLQNEMAEIENGHIQTLRASHLGEYELGYTQGCLHILSMLTSRETPTPERVAKLRDTATGLLGRLQQLKMEPLQSRQPPPG